MKKRVRFAAVALLLAALVGCSSGQQSAAPGTNTPAQTNDAGNGGSAGKQEVIKLALATGGQTGTYFPVGTGIANAISQDGRFEVTAQTSGGGIANVKMLQDNEVQLGMSASNTTYAGFKGVDPFDSPADKVRAIAALYPETFQFVAPKDSGLKTLADLKGKKVAVGSPGSGTERTGKLMLEAHGLTYDDIKPEFMGFSEAVTAMQDKTIDAAIIGAGIPTAAVVDAAATIEITLLQVEQEKFQHVLEQEPSLTMVTIPAGTYQGIDEDVLTVASPALLLTNTDQSEEVIYEVTKAIFDNASIVHATHVQGKNLSLENALTGVSIPLHPGAEKYYKEQGLEVK